MFAPNSLIVLLMVLIPASLRLMDLQWNIACIGALSIFCGLYIRQRWLAIAIPLAAMAVSDVALGLAHGKLAFYTTDPSRPIVYASYAIMIALGMSVRSNWQRNGAKASWQRYVPVAGATLGGSLFFFFATNFGVWALNDFYPHTGQGLVQCVAAGIPFYRTTLSSDLVFTLMFVGAYELFVKSRVPVTSAARLLYAE